MVGAELGSVAPLTAGRDALLVLAGLGAGIFNGVAGGGTLISFPTLLAMGFPAITANMTSSVGIWPGYVGGVVGFRSQIEDQRSTVRTLAPVAVVGALGGAVLLITTSATVFARLAPWLVLFASALFAIQPLLVKRLNIHAEHPVRRVVLLGGTFLAALYGGYFGAGIGVVLLAVLGLALPDTLLRTSGMRAALSVLVSAVAGVVFIARGTLVWQAVAMLAIGSLLGGYLGARAATRLPAGGLRVVVVLIGTATALRLLVG
jgi:uncharacterized membrane protein YfcA